MATVSSMGLVTGVSAGTSIITYTNSGGYNTTAKVTVYALPAPPAPIKGPKKVCAGNAITLSNPTKGGTWSSSSPSIAKISAAGVVTGVAEGTAILKYTMTNANGCKNFTSMTLTVGAPPAQPDKFTKYTTSISSGQSNVAYTVPLEAEVDYDWSYSGNGAKIKGNTNSVLINFSKTATSGTLSVTASNPCGTSAARTLDISVLKGIMISDNTFQGSVDTTSTFDLPVIQNVLSVYPNPTLGSVTFKFRINENARVKLDIYTVNGLLIARVFDGDAEAGIAKSVKFDQPLYTGIYPCVLRWNQKMITVKLVILQ